MLNKKNIIVFFVFFILLVFLISGCSENTGKNEIYKSVSDLEGTRVGVVTGTTFDILAKQCWDNCDLVYVNSFTDLISALSSNKIDCFITDEPWISYLIRTNSDITYIKDKIKEEDYGLVFAKSDEGTELRDDFNAFLEELPDTEKTFSELRGIWCNGDENEHPILNYEALPAENGTIRICTEVTNPPFEFYENERIVGYNIQLLYMYCKDRGYGMKVDDMKFDSLIPAIVSGKYDIASSSFSITPERAEEVNFSNIVYKGGPVVAIRTENSATYKEKINGKSFFDKVVSSFEKTFIRENRWKLFTNGIGITLLITVISLLSGTVLGFGLYMWYRKGGKIIKKFTEILSWFVTGMPEVLLLLILFYIVFGHSEITGTWVSVFAFTLIVGVNVFGMTKGGVEAIDRGQMEAALAIGYSENRGFFKIILPQALQYIMPNYRANVTSLIKSTAIVGYLAVQDLTKVSDIVRSRTYEAFFPLVVTAAIYFILAWILIFIVNKLQGKLLPIRNNREKILKGIIFQREEEEN